MLERQSRYAIAASLLWILLATAAVFGTHRPAESADISAAEAVALPRVEVSQAEVIAQPANLPAEAPAAEAITTARC